VISLAETRRQAQTTNDAAKTIDDIQTTIKVIGTSLLRRVHHLGDRLSGGGDGV
jgi:hypothetical protein